MKQAICAGLAVAILSMGVASVASAQVLLASENGTPMDSSPNTLPGTEDRTLRGVPKAGAVLWSKYATEVLADELRAGGHVLAFSWRSDREDASPVPRLSGRSINPILNAAERDEARAIGIAFRAARVPVSLVVASTHPRARDAAELAFLRAPRLAVDLTPANGTALHRYLVRPPKGLNAVVVGHRLAAGDVSPVSDWNGLPDGVCAVYRFDAEGEPKLVALLGPDDWAKLAKGRTEVVNEASLRVR
jgi:hypothetical protein